MPLASSVVNLALPVAVEPISTLSIAPLVAGLIVTVPVPVGCKLIFLLALLTVNAPVPVMSPVIFAACPTFKFLAIPTPPAVVILPLVVKLLCVVLCTFK